MIAHGFDNVLNKPSPVGNQILDLVILTKYTSVLLITNSRLIFRGIYTTSMRRQHVGVHVHIERAGEVQVQVAVRIPRCFR